jgi:hypothetical protein
MIRMEKQSRLAKAEVIEKAVALFGPGGLGLEVKERAECCARFEGGGGYVFIQAGEGKDGKGAQVQAEGREWDYLIRQFLMSI